MHSVHEQGGFKSKEDFRWNYELNYYGKDFDREQNDESDAYETDFFSYEGALEAGIIKALNLI